MEYFINDWVGGVHMVEKDFSKVHGFFDNEFKFNPKVYVKTPDIEKDEEIIKCENFHIVTLKNDTCISDSLRQNRFFEKFIMAFMTMLIPKNKNMLDIGSNIGLWSILYSGILKDNIIYSFEPQLKVFNCFNKTLESYNINNVKTHNFALSNVEDIKYMNADYSSKNNFGAFAISDNDKLLKIECKVGDELGFENIGFIKIDVEGHELEVLKGLRNTIIRDKPILSIEIHRSSVNYDQTLNYIADMGYNKYIKFTHCDYAFFQ
jgi:FkbM family methyltransferase